jgi:pleiotropic regulator 1
VTRHYHGHTSGVYALALHPTLDILCSGGRDSVVRVWDIRTKHQIHVLTGHDNTIGSILTNSVDPQIISGSHDTTIKVSQWVLFAFICRFNLSSLLVMGFGSGKMYVHINSS